MRKFNVNYSVLKYRASNPIPCTESEEATGSRGPTAIRRFY